MTNTRKKERPGSPTFYAQVKHAFNSITPGNMLAFYERRIKGQGDELKMAVYSVYKFLEAIAEGESVPADNWILTAPSGAGKTEFFRTTKAYFQKNNIPIPVVQIDLSLLTEEGFKGDNPTVIPLRILNENPDCGGTAICFFDEADKKFIPSYTSYGTDANAAVQANLLTLTEGLLQTIPVNETTAYEFDSSRTMFVFLGAFQSLRKEKLEENRKKSAIGFGSQIGSGKDAQEDLFYADLDMDDLIRYGIMDELAGRITFVLNFHKLSREAMRDLLIDKTDEISQDLGIRIELTDKGMEALLGISFGNLGARAPLNLIRKLALSTVSRVFFDETFQSHRDTVMIDGTDSAYIQKPGYSRDDIFLAQTAAH